MASFEKIYKEWREMQPWDEETQYRLQQRFAVDFNFNSNHIEGNTLTYGQTELLLLFGKVAGEARMRDCEEMKASNVCLRMVEIEANEQAPSAVQTSENSSARQTSENSSALQTPKSANAGIAPKSPSAKKSNPKPQPEAGFKPLTQSFIRHLHETLLREDYEVHRQLPNGDHTSYTVHVGQYKTRPNSVITPTGERFDYASPEETPALMSDLVEWYNEAETSGSIPPVELAALLLYRFIRIHPFEDGNGRIARLLSNYTLLRHHYPMVVVRSRKKREYLEALSDTDKLVGITPSKGAHASLREIRHFLSYFRKLVSTAMIFEIRFATTHDERIWWHDGEMVRFRSNTTGKILSAIMIEPEITTKKLSHIVGVTPTAVNKHIKNLAEKGYIQRNEGDGWHVVIYPSQIDNN